jgi:hypothetical protein
MKGKKSAKPATRGAKPSAMQVKAEKKVSLTGLRKSGGSAGSTGTTYTRFDVP